MPFERKYIAAEPWWSAQSLVKAMRAKARVSLMSTERIRLRRSGWSRPPSPWWCCIAQNWFSVLASGLRKHGGCRPAGPPALYYSLFRQALCARIGLALCTELDPPSRNLGVVGFSVAWAPVHRQNIRMRHLYWTLLTLWLLRIPTFGQFNPHKVLQDALVLENRGSFETAANFAKAASMR